ncbi:unnamed protein product, partial [Owenia fusiformis]
EMTHIPSLANKLKLKWIKKLTDNNIKSKWKILWQQQLEDIREHAWEYNLREINPMIASNIKLTAARDVYNAWCAIHFKEYKDIHTPENQIIWNNRHVQNRRETLYIEGWKSKGIIYIKQLYEDNQLIPYQALKRKFDLINTTFIQWYHIIHSIPAEWRNQIKTPRRTETETDVKEESISIKELQTMTNKDTYNIL